MATPGKMLAPGDQAPAFELDQLGGGRTSLQDLLAAGPAVLAFFKVTCPTCQFTFPFLERLHRAGVTVAGISQDDPASTREFKEEFGVSFPVLLDQRGYPASNGFGIAYVPAMFCVEPDGTISWALEGFGKRDIEALGLRFGAALFRPGEYVPEWKAG